ncbi:MAG: DUF4199 domain-containing protein [Paludibacteraceae bacterium]|nr:DUF4199 domain-containing protein [Paludibacteraceae bacterium]MBP9648792.1 DUF4199 domain-containing protein [Paludibacteraceae bacterium]MBP9970333.1 DUF4199 domain-containing protein [Paludibacteraceae bacterium]NLK91783.1 DUF4199 domain-containing protein [Bacteroidales bacterium]HOR41428.1 DUF4199 domain-containing protein [Paludibacteraceae bacterium]
MWIFILFMMKDSSSSSTLVQSAMFYGMYLGAFLLFRFGLNVLATDTVILSFVVFFLTLFIPILAYILLVRFKKSLPLMEINFRQAYMFTFFLFLFGSLILAIVQYFYYQYINTDFLYQQYQVVLQNSTLLLQEFPQMKPFIQELKQSGVPSAIAVASQNIWIYSFTGIIIGIVLGLIVKTKQKT